MRTGLVVTVVLISGVLKAQGPPPMRPQGGDPPARMARLNLIEGPVSLQPAGMDAWTAASPNYPLTTGDHLYADAAARAEMQVPLRGSERGGSGTDPARFDLFAPLLGQIRFLLDNPPAGSPPPFTSHRAELG